MIGQLLGRARPLDRRVFREDLLNTPEGWLSAVRQWRAVLAVAVVSQAGAGWFLLHGNGGGLFFLLFGAQGAYYAGYYRAELARLTGEPRAVHRWTLPALLPRRESPPSEAS